MSQPSIQQLLDHAILQVVGESHLDLTSKWGNDNLSLDVVLGSGNNHPQRAPDGPGATKLTPTQIDWFKKNYEIISHYPNDRSGFSATLMQNKFTGEYKLSFRSTEYAHQEDGGDWERDGAKATDGEISGIGFPMAQMTSLVGWALFLCPRR